MKKKIAQIFRTLPSEGSSYKAIINQLDTRGKMDMKGMIGLVTMMLEEIDELKKRLPEPKTK